MGQRTVNDRQLHVLRWIGDGCPPGAVDSDTTYKTTATALQNRRLVKVTKKRGVWSAAFTDAGRHFLDHGAYPTGHWDMPEREATREVVAEAARRASRRPAVTGKRPVDQLLEDVVAAGGRLVRTEGERGYWENLVGVAARYGKVPAGKVLSVQGGGSWSEHVITLTDAPAWMTAELAPVPVAERLHRPHPVVAAIKSEPTHLGVSATARGRALRILDALAKEARARGYAVRAPRPEPGYGRAKGLLEVEIVGTALVIDLDELNNRVPHVPTAAELREKQRYSWTRIPTHDQVPSGRLRLRILTGWVIRGEKFTDTKTIDLVDRLPEVLQELELRAGAAEERRLQREREEVARRDRWAQALEAAKVAAAEHHRAETLAEQVERWLECRDLDAYLDAADQAAEAMVGDNRHRAVEWLAWARGYRQRLDPLTSDLRMPATPTFTSEDLRPYMMGYLHTDREHGSRRPVVDPPTSRRTRDDSAFWAGGGPAAQAGTRARAHR